MANSVSGSMISGEAVVVTAGTPVPIGTGIKSSIVLIAKSGNTGQIYVGGSDVDSSVNDGLAPGDALGIAPSARNVNLEDLYIDADANGEGVDFYALS